MSVDYDERRSFFGLRGDDLDLRSDDWNIASWRGRLTWDGWEAAKLSLLLRRTTRQGEIHRSFYGLNEIYPLRIDLDDTADEMAVRLESRSLPVRLTFEQAWTEFERRDRYSPDGPGAIGVTDPDELADINSRRVDEQSGATGTLTASYGNERMEIVASGGYSLTDFDSNGATATSFDLGGGAIGTVQMIDDAIGSADQDTTAGRLRFALRLAPEWTLRLVGDYRDATTDASLLGARLIRISNPGGAGLEIRSALDESTMFDMTEQGARMELAWSRGALSLRAGGFTADRDVEWLLEQDDQRTVDRGSDGSLLGLAWKGTRFSIDADYTRGTFEKYVFRTDPETVDRATLHMRGRLAQNWELRGSGRFESADNPSSQSALDHDSFAYTLGLAWAAPGSGSSFGLEVDRTDLTTETGIVLPGHTGATSVYDLSLLTATARGQVLVRGMVLAGSVTRTTDRGDTWPLTSWMGSTRLSIRAPRNTEISLFGEYWSYDEERGSLDDYDTLRYGVALNWRFN